MAKLHRVGTPMTIGPSGGIYVSFWCPGCGCSHMLEAGGTSGWKWNGSLDAPTLHPSILVDGHRADRRCHSFVENGLIRYLGDSHHVLAGKAVALPEWSDE